MQPWKGRNKKSRGGEEKRSSGSNIKVANTLRTNFRKESGWKKKKGRGIYKRSN